MCEKMQIVRVSLGGVSRKIFYLDCDHTAQDVELFPAYAFAGTLFLFSKLITNLMGCGAGRRQRGQAVVTTSCRPCGATTATRSGMPQQQLCTQ